MFSTSVAKAWGWSTKLKHIRLHFFFDVAAVCFKYGAEKGPVIVALQAYLHPDQLTSNPLSLRRFWMRLTSSRAIPS